MTNFFKNISLNKVYKKEDSYVASFTSLTLISENNISVYNIAEPKILLNLPDPPTFNKIYSILSICMKVDNPITSCKENLETSFPTISTEKEGSILKISLPIEISKGYSSINEGQVIKTKNVKIYLAVDLSRNLQGIENTFI